MLRGIKGTHRVSREEKRRQGIQGVAFKVVQTHMNDHGLTSPFSLHGKVFAAYSVRVRVHNTLAQ